MTEPNKLDCYKLDKDWITTMAATQELTEEQIINSLVHLARDLTPVVYATSLLTRYKHDWLKQPSE